ncbi:hypothetical protein [Lentibacillus saliphilus]|nr:hypothetical protein [Lentibacillus saliphilus]
MDNFEMIYKEFECELGRQLNDNEVEFILWLYGRFQEDQKITVS